MKIIKARKEYGGRISYEILSYGDLLMVWVFFIVAIILSYSLYALGNTYSNRCEFDTNYFVWSNLCSRILVADVIRIMIIIFSIVIIFNEAKNKWKIYDIIAGKDMQILILRQKNIFNILKNEEKICFEDIIGIKFECLDTDDKKCIIGINNYNLEIFGKPIVVLKSGKNIEIFNFLKVKEFLSIASKINIVLKSYHEDVEEPSRVKSKSHDVSVKDL